MTTDSRWFEFFNKNRSAIEQSEREFVNEMRRHTQTGQPDELAQALLIAHNALDRPNADPDSDLCIVSRQLARLVESVERLIELNAAGAVRLTANIEPRQIARFVERLRGARIATHAKTLHHDD